MKHDALATLAVLLVFIVNSDTHAQATRNQEGHQHGTTDGRAGSESASSGTVRDQSDIVVGVSTRFAGSNMESTCVGTRVNDDGNSGALILTAAHCLLHPNDVLKKIRRIRVTRGGHQTDLDLASCRVALPRMIWERLQVAQEASGHTARRMLIQSHAILAASREELATRLEAAESGWGRVPDVAAIACGLPQHRGLRDSFLEVFPADGPEARVVRPESAGGTSPFLDASEFTGMAVAFACRGSGHETDLGGSGPYGICCSSQNMDQSTILAGERRTATRLTRAPYENPVFRIAYDVEGEEHMRGTFGDSGGPLLVPRGWVRNGAEGAWDDPVRTNEGSLSSGISGADWSVAAILSGINPIPALGTVRDYCEESSQEEVSLAYYYYSGGDLESVQCAGAAALRARAPSWCGGAVAEGACSTNGLFWQDVVSDATMVCENP